LLTAVGSLPILTAGIDVIPPPDGLKNLSILSSLICIIVLGICILFKATFVSLSMSRRISVRAIPPLIAFTLVVLGVVLTVHYTNAQASSA
jgi:hypothetical protein